MRPQEEQPLKAVIEEFLQTFRLTGKLKEQRLMDAWPRVAGDLIARHTISLSVRKRVLWVKIDSPALRSELLFARQKLLRDLNAEAGGNIVDEIVFN